MMNNLLANEEQSRDNGDEVLQKAAGNTLNRTWEQRESFNEKWEGKRYLHLGSKKKNKISETPEEKL